MSGFSVLWCMLFLCFSSGVRKSTTPPLFELVAMFISTCVLGNFWVTAVISLKIPDGYNGLCWAGRVHSHILSICYLSITWG